MIWVMILRGELKSERVCIIWLREKMSSLTIPGQVMIILGLGAKLERF
jgi:hypothetical protein